MSIEAITGSIVESVTSEPTESAELPIEGSSEIAAPQGDSDLAQRLAILAKKEKGLLAKQQEQAARLKEYEEKASKLKQWEELEGLLQKDPVEFFKKKNVDFNDVQQKWLSSLNDEDIDPIQKQIKELQTKLASKDDEYKALLEEKLNERENVKKQQEIEEQSKYYNQELKKFITDKADQYDLINTFEASDEVFNVIKTVYLKTAEKGNPKLMTFDEACDLYEKKLEEHVQSMKKSKKVTKIFGVEDSEDIFGKVSGQITLDDSFSPSSAHSPELKTESERLRAAAKLFEQQLKA